MSRKKRACPFQELAATEDLESKVLTHESRIDRISDLPWPALDNILGRLPIKEAMRTSVLSKQWRYKWVYLSTLAFDDDCVSETPDYGEEALVNLVYHVLLRHCGKIHSFILTSGLVSDRRPIEIWMDFLARNSIERLFIKSSCFESFVVPLSIFSCQQLTHLHASNVVMAVPHNHKGFKHLVSLELEQFSTSVDYFTDIALLASLISNCPNLRRLVLKDMDPPTRFIIQASKLEYLYLEGMPLGIVLENCPSLEDITLIIVDEDQPSTNEYPVKEFTCNLLWDLSCLPSLKRLQINGAFLQYLYMWDKSKGHFTASNHLKLLKLNKFCPTHLGETSTALKFLEVFSNLQELHTSVESSKSPGEASGVLAALRQTTCCFNLLHIAKVDILSVNYYNLKIVLEFIKFVLARSPSLETMIIVNHHNAIQYNTHVMGKLLQFPRASQQAQIMYYPCR